MTQIYRGTPRTAPAPAVTDDHPHGRHALARAGAPRRVAPMGGHPIRPGRTARPVDPPQVDDIESLVRSTPLGSLAQAVREQLLGYAGLVHLRPGELLQRSELEPFVALVVSGVARVYVERRVGPPTMLRRAREGSFISFAAILDGSEPEIVAAIGDVVLLQFDVDDFLEACESSAEVSSALAQEIAVLGGETAYEPVDLPDGPDRGLQPGVRQHVEQVLLPGATRSLVRHTSIAAGTLVAAGSVFGLVVLNDAPPTGAEAPALVGAQALDGPGALDHGGRAAPASGSSTLDPGPAAPASWLSVAFPDAVGNEPDPEDSRSVREAVEPPAADTGEDPPPAAAVPEAAEEVLGSPASFEPVTAVQVEPSVDPVDPADTGISGAEFTAPGFGLDGLLGRDGPVVEAAPDPGEDSGEDLLLAPADLTEDLGDAEAAPPAPVSVAEVLTPLPAEQAESSPAPQDPAGGFDDPTTGLVGLPPETPAEAPAPEVTVDVADHIPSSTGLSPEVPVVEPALEPDPVGAVDVVEGVPGLVGLPPETPAGAPAPELAVEIPGGIGAPSQSGQYLAPSDDPAEDPSGWASSVAMGDPAMSTLGMEPFGIFEAEGLVL